MIELLEKFQCPCPGMNALAHIAGIMTGQDYYKNPRTLKKLGLNSLSQDALLDYVVEGPK